MEKLKCQKCGNNENFYVKEKYKGRCLYFFRTDGEESENGEMYQSACHSLASKFIYCTECDAKVKKLTSDEEITDYISHE